MHDKWDISAETTSFELEKNKLFIYLYKIIKNYIYNIKIFMKVIKVIFKIHEYMHNMYMYNTLKMHNK